MHHKGFEIRSGSHAVVLHRHARTVVEKLRRTAWPLAVQVRRRTGDRIADARHVAETSSLGSAAASTTTPRRCGLGRLAAVDCLGRG